MKDVFAALKKAGQILGPDLAKLTKTNERTVAVQLWPYIKNGEVMACNVFDGEGKQLGVEYRISGVIPQQRPGPKAGPLVRTL